MTLEEEIDELMDYSRSIAEVAESDEDEANRMSAEYFADYYKQLAEWLKELAERRKQPEIIYCKDCENWDTTWQNDSAPNYHYCPMIDGTYSGDFYCAKAERRTDG